MEIEHINPSEIFNHPAFSSIVTVTDPRKFHFIAGRCSADANYQCVAPGNLLEQYKEVMRLLTLELNAVGAGWNDVVYRRIFTLDVDECLKAGADPAIAAYFDQDKMPPSTLVGVTRLSDPEFMIEIDLMAVTD